MLTHSTVKDKISWTTGILTASLKQLAKRKVCSHAAIFVDNWFRFESNDDGVLYTPIRVAKCFPGAGTDRKPETLPPILEDVSHYAKVAVYRHRRLDQAEPEIISNSIRHIVNDFLGKQYPELEKLASASTSWKWAQQPMGLALAALDLERLGKVLNPGPFCSELVATVLQQLDCQLFDEERNPKEINPNHLANSRLEIQDHMISNKCDYTSPSDETMVQELNMNAAGLARDAMQSLVDSLVQKEKIRQDMMKFDQLITEFKDRCSGKKIGSHNKLLAWFQGLFGR